MTTWLKYCAFVFLTFYVGLDFLKAADSEKVIKRRSVLRGPTQGVKHRVRIKDIAAVAEMHPNMLVGYGLVVGLNRTGDNLGNVHQTKASLSSMLERLGVKIPEGATPGGRNVAAVMITATLPAFSRRGSRIDVTVSTIGDAVDLKGGTLMVTPLMGADGEIYAVAQGPVSPSGRQARGRAASEVKGVPTSGEIINGAVIEKEVGFELTNLKNITLALRNPDFTTAYRMKDAINKYFTSGDIAQAKDPSTIFVKVPANYKNNIVNFMRKVEQLRVEPDQKARIVIDEKTGVIVIPENVMILPVAVKKNSVTVRILEMPEVSQPNAFTNVLSGMSNKFNVNDIKLISNNETPFSEKIMALNSRQATDLRDLLAKQAEEVTNLDKILSTLSDQTIIDQRKKDFYAAQDKELKTLQLKHQGEQSQLQLEHYKQEGRDTNKLTPVQQATVVDRTKLSVSEEKEKFAIVDGGTNLEDLVNALNALGVSTQDMIHILQSIKKSGALQAEIVVA